jgi:RecB family exonuclease
MPTLTLPVIKSPAKAFDHISYSAISTFQTCPLRFCFRYVLGLPVTTISASLVFGSAMRQAVQFHFEQLLVGRPAPDLDTLLAIYQEYWESCPEETVLFGKDENRDTLGRLADRSLRIFMESDFARPKGVILGIEEELRGQIIPGCPDLLARVDLIVDDGDELHVSDFKTARCSWSDHKVDDTAPQLILYSELVKPIADGRPIKLSFAVLTKTKLPVLAVHDVPLDAQQVERTKRTVERIWRAIQAVAANLRVVSLP